MKKSSQCKPIPHFGKGKAILVFGALAQFALSCKRMLHVFKLLNLTDKQVQTDFKN